MPIPDVTQIAQPYGGFSPLPARFPALPEDVLQRFPSLNRTMEQQALWYRQLRNSFSTSLDELAVAVNDGYRNHAESYTELIARSDNALALISQEAQARIDGDNAVIAYVNSQISSSSGFGSRVYVQNTAPATPAINDIWLDLDDGLHPYYYDGANWVDATDSRIPGAFAAVASEATARTTADSAMATNITALLASVDTPTTGLLARVTTIESTYATDAEVAAAISTAISAEVTARDSAISASVTSESTARAAADSAMATDINALEATIYTPTTGMLAIVTDIASTYATDAEVAAAIATAIAATSSIGSKVYVQNSAPSGSLNVNDIWYDLDDGMKPYYWSGSAWVDATDTRIPGAFAAITTEQSARVAADSAAATAITALEASVNTPTTGLLARVTTIESTYVTASGVSAAVNTAISASISSSSAGTIGAALTTEATVRATFDGQLNATYTLTAVAGNVTTGMRLLSTSGGATDISAVVFQADRFQIYNGSSGIPTFNLNAGSLRLTSNVTVLGAVAPAVAAPASTAGLYLGSDRMGYWTGSAWKAYISNTGLFEFQGNGSNFILWNGSVMQVRGVVEVTSGFLGANANSILVTASGIDVGTSGRILGGASAPGTGNGFFLGYSAGQYQFYAGAAVGNYIRWDGATLTTNGVIQATSGYFGSAATAVAIGASGLNVGTTGNIRGGALGPNSGNGFFLGYDTGSYKFFAGNGVSSYVLWNGATLTVQGDIRGTSGYFGTPTGVLVDSSGLTFSSTGAIRSVGTTYGTSGLWMGYDAGAPKFFVGTWGSSGLHWTGSALEVQGVVRATAGYIGSGTTAVLISSGGLDVGTTGRILGGASGPGVGNGFWMGYASAAYQLYFGNGNDKYIWWNGTNITVAGSIIAQGGSIGGFVIDSDRLRTADNSVVIQSLATGGIKVGGVTIGNTAVSLPEVAVVAGGAGRMKIVNVSGVFKSSLQVDIAQFNDGFTSPVASVTQVSFNWMTSPFFDAGVTTAVDVKNVNQRWLNGTTQVARVDIATGRYYVMGLPVVNARWTGSVPTTVADIWAILQYHGLG